MAVAVADGARTISDVAVLADQAELFGPVASDSTCWRLLERLDTALLGAVGPISVSTVLPRVPLREFPPVSFPQ